MSVVLTRGIAAQGVVVESVWPGSAADRAGIRPGDHLLSWSAPGEPGGATESGEIRSPFDLEELNADQLDRTAVRATVRRGTALEQVEVPTGSWGAATRPPMGMRQLLELGHPPSQPDHDLSAAVLSRHGLAAAARHRGDASRAAWIYNRWAKLHCSAGQSAAARRLFDLAAAAAHEAGRPRVQSWIDTRAGRELDRPDQGVRAPEHLQRAVRRQLSLSADGLALAGVLHDLGLAHRRLRDLDAAERCYLVSTAMRQRRGPGGLGMGLVLSDLGVIMQDRQRFAPAAILTRGALRIINIHEPESLRAAGAINGLGVIAWKANDYATAEAHFRHALEIRERLEPGSMAVASSLNNLGSVAGSRGDLAAAEDYFRRSLAIKQELRPDSLAVAYTLNNLGFLLHRRGELEAARVLHDQALGIRAKLAPDSLDVAHGLGTLGLLLADSGELDEAEEVFHRALDIRRRHAPESLGEAAVLQSLGHLAQMRSELETARDLHRRALLIREDAAPGSHMVASSLRSLGVVASSSGDLNEAEALLRRAEAITCGLVPASEWCAHTLYRLASVLRAGGRTDEALDLYARALAELEAQQGTLGGTERSRSSFRAMYIGYFIDYLELLLETGQAEAAYEILERSRARALLTMLAERDLVFQLDLPAELERERRMVNKAFDRTQAMLMRLSPIAQEDEVERLHHQLHELRRRRERITAEAESRRPGLASLGGLAALGVEETRRALDPGTTMLSYAVGADASHLFVIDRHGAFSVRALAIGQDELATRVTRLRRMLHRQPPRQLTNEPAIDSELCALWELLLAPAAEVIAGAERLLLVPDGALHVLPFAALCRCADGGRPTHLVEEAPLHQVVSASVYQELQRRRPVVSPTRNVVAFGDPRYRVPDAIDASGRAAPGGGVGRGLKLEPIPATRDEVTAIASLFGREAIVFLGTEASEENAKQLGSGPTIIHFACHGLVNEMFPLESSLALTIPEQWSEGQDNGLLQAWEILERLRIDADLVTLSACQSALGKEVAGEGLVGLTWAFHYAGARSVVASLWNVGDRSTAALMRHFYSHLAAGASKDVALQRAQLALIRRPVELDVGGDRVEHDFSSPFHWAAFCLIGDWR